MLLYSQIGDSVDKNGNITYGISGSSFANELQWLQNNCKSISVRINSIGGSVLDGYSIVSAILSSKVPCNTYIDGLAASIAGVIALAGKKCYMMDYGTMMLHNPSGGNDKAVTALVKETLVTLISNRSSKTAEEINIMMDAETWLTASEALNSGFVDEIITSGKKIKMKKDSLYEMANVYNKLINPKKNTMNKVTDFLKLKNEASEEEVIKAIETKDTDLASKDAEIAALSERLKVYEDAEKAAKEAALEDIKNKATALVNKAKEDGKIKEEEVEGLVSLAITNFSTVENMFAKISNVKQNNNPVFDFKVKNAAGEVEDRSKWTFKDWSKNDAKGLADMQNSFPEQFNELVKTLKVTL
jgi:ATP-dependent protease ClpP protease subunit